MNAVVTNVVLVALFWSIDSVARMACSVMRVVCFVAEDLINWLCVVADMGVILFPPEYGTFLLSFSVRGIFGYAPFAGPFPS